MKPPVLDFYVFKKILLAQNTSAFLEAVVSALEERHGRGVKSNISRKAGFSSRSYLTEIVAGKKGFSRDSLSRLKGALPLDKSWLRLFEYLAWLEDPKLRPPTLSVGELRQEIKNLRITLERQMSQKPGYKVAEPNIRRPQVFQVYAALGDEKTGATLDEIEKRTGLRHHSICVALRQLVVSGAVLQNGDRYFAVAMKADALGVKEPEVLADLIHIICTDLQKRRVHIAKVPTNLTIYSAFSVRREQIPLLKDRLEAAIFEVLDEFQVDAGNQVQQVFLSMHGQPLS